MAGIIRVVVIYMEGFMKRFIYFLLMLVLICGCGKGDIIDISNKNKDMVSLKGLSGKEGYLLITRNGSKKDAILVDVLTGKVNKIKEGDFLKPVFTGDRILFNIFDDKSGGIYSLSINSGKVSVVNKDYRFRFSPALSQDAAVAAFVGYGDDSFDTNIYYMDTKKGLPQKIVKTDESVIDLSFGKGNDLLYSREYKDKSMAIKKYQIFRYSVKDMKEERIRISSDNDVSPVLSPDGKKLAYISDKYVDYNLYIMDIQTGDVKLLASEDAVVGGSIKWSSDSRHISYVKLKGGALYRVKTVNVESGVTYEIGQGDVICFSPCGKYVAYASYDPKTKKQVIYRKKVNGEGKKEIFNYTEESIYSRSINIFNWIENIKDIQ